MTRLTAIYRHCAAARRVVAIARARRIIKNFAPRKTRERRRRRMASRIHQPRKTGTPGAHRSSGSYRLVAFDLMSQCAAGKNTGGITVGNH